MPQEIQKNKFNLLIEILCQLDQSNQTRQHLWSENVYSIDWKEESVRFHFFLSILLSHLSFSSIYFSFYGIFLTKFVILFCLFVFKVFPGLSNIWRQPGFTTGQSPEENFGKICKNWGLVYLIGDLIPLVSKVLSPSSSWHGDRRTNKQPTESKSKNKSKSKL